MSLLVYPSLIETGAENMASDWWLMQHSVKANLPLFRHYQWEKPQISFGYGQKWQWVEQEAGEAIENLIRRPTGGGIVRHGHDWTYCLVLPRGHPSYQIPSLDLYEFIHAAMGRALASQSITTFLQPCEVEKKAGIPGDCFHEPVGKDLMIGKEESKIAGAAMKRTRSAILMQGTLEIEKLSTFNSKIFHHDFLEQLLGLLEQDFQKVEWPPEFCRERKIFCQQFDSSAWRKNRERI
ncbi:MAG: hypothetical protein P8N49_06695 [Opitutales bacterium]|nr:hypothetical protein [Opitutales bacterium]